LVKEQREKKKHRVVMSDRFCVSHEGQRHLHGEVTRLVELPGEAVRKQKESNQMRGVRAA